MEDVEPEPEQPEVLQIIRKSRLFNIPIFNGSYFDWPYLSTLELMICTNTERDHEETLAVNAQFRLKALAEKQAIGNNG